MSTFPASGLSRLAKRVLAGEVVFFIGAGFSLDSEGNSAGCLIRRLLARFLAMAEGLKTESSTADEAKCLLASLCRMFSLKGEATQPDSLANHQNVTLLVREYYHINDWICSAFSILLDQLSRLPKKTRTMLLKNVHDREQGLLQELEEDSQWFEARGVPLQPIRFDDLESLGERYRGKALFLDTMGFADLRVMAGRPGLRRLEDVMKSYGNRLFARHAVLAQFAREGLCDTILTTNYDLLIEGAYRLAGLVPTELSTSGGPEAKPLLPTDYESFSRIASAEEFFRQGVGFRSALIVKIHGCVERYRMSRELQAEDSRRRDWQNYLPAMVFTFREIQNWREDSWSRDYLCTLLRTRTLVFAGYSGMDPVLHDTFRTVYEEMARYQARKRTAPGSSDPDVGAVATSSLRMPPQARAFLFGFADRQEFHCMEILRAASTAAGARRASLTAHPNYLPFQRRSADGPEPFPTLDDLMLWLAHLVFRRRQWQTLKSALRRILVLLLGHPGAEADILDVERRFRQLWREELRVAHRWAKDTPAEGGAEDTRGLFERVVGWTTRFQTSFLRELALAEAVVRYQGPGFDIEALRRRPWYHPANDHPDWTAWGAVLELATRRLISSWRGELDRWAEDCSWVRPEGGDHARILFARGKEEPTPSCVTIRLTSFDRVGTAVNVPGVLRTHAIWQLHPDTLPWPAATMAFNESAGPTPPAEVIWGWASAPRQRLEVTSELSRWPAYFGGGDG